MTSGLEMEQAYSERSR